MKIIRIVAVNLITVLALTVSGCGGTPGLKHKDVALDSSLRGGTVLLIPPQIQIFEIGVSQIKERRADMEEDVAKRMVEAANEFSQERGWFKPLPMPILKAEEQYEFDQRMALAWANQQMYAAIKLQRGTAVSALENEFHGAVGKSPLLSSLSSQTGARYALLIVGSDSYTTGAAKLASLASTIATLGHAPLVLNGTGELSVCLIELNTGNILWVASDTTKRDLTDLNNHKRMLKNLLQESPLGAN